ncbi:Na+/H+ antiporter NhaC family protein [Rhodocaloribacter litoris]|uniref:Na+/H+ antiporter NhaC family protein n=1 Tax=Rhodocaloribacter litoris TaxID=2558931 RepID=UPI00141F383C|nr:Na+/H+ antiporter NhaC family protein [Rhodocaloribacter litoris]QXD15211.1 Na+/H+ antiporter NhaC family protein [Rhodocaloribacter litoris]
MQRLLLLLVFLGVARPAPAQDYTLEVPGVVLRDVPFSVAVRSPDVLFDEVSAVAYRLCLGDATPPLTCLGGEAVPLAFQRGDDGTRRLVAEGLTVPGTGAFEVALLHNGLPAAVARSRAVPGWLSILPPLLAIAIALAFKRVIPALFLGIWVGAWTAAGGGTGFWSGLLDTFQVYVAGALADPDHAAIILFSLMIGGMVGIISRNGGMQGIVNRIVRWARDARRGQLATALLGIAIFFDDYANTLVVGGTMRPVTDRLRISREKLAYIVDSTAAPVAALAFVTTWIGFEVGLIGDAVGKIDGLDLSAYSIFLHSIPYSFYPILALFFVFVVAGTNREFGPMWEAETRARTTGQVLRPGASIDEEAAEGKDVQPKPDKPHRLINAVLPILVLVGGVLVGLYVTGEGEHLRDIIGSADSYKALMWASLLGTLTAALLSVGQRILSLEETIEAWYAGLKAMLFAMIILVLAWALSEITEVLHTAAYLVHLLGEALPPGVVPALVFLLAAATAFATGSSWGTMGILLPLVVPLVWAILQANDMADPAHYHVLYSTVASILAGSVWGDHCSPISDTTILSSMASGCDHIDHVRTQLPYAALVGTTGLLLGELPVGFGMPWWVALLLGMGVLVAAMRFLGRTVPAAPVTAEPSTPVP